MSLTVNWRVWRGAGASPVTGARPRSALPSREGTERRCPAQGSRRRRATEAGLAASESLASNIALYPWGGERGRVVSPRTVVALNGEPQTCAGRCTRLTHNHGRAPGSPRGCTGGRPRAAAARPRGRVGWRRALVLRSSQAGQADADNVDLVLRGAAAGVLPVSSRRAKTVRPSDRATSCCYPSGRGG